MSGEWFPWSHPMMLRYEDDGASNGIIEDVEWNNVEYSESYGPQYMQRSANTGRFTTLDPLESVEVRWGETGPIQPLNPIMAVPMVTTVTRPNDAEEFFVRGRIAQSHVTTNWVKSNERTVHPGPPANPSYSNDVTDFTSPWGFIEGTTWTTVGELWVVVTIPARASKIHCQMGTALREGDEGTRHHLINAQTITLSFPNLVGSREGIVIFRRHYIRPRNTTESHSVKTVVWAENIMGESEKVERYHRWVDPTEATSNTVQAPAPTTSSSTGSTSSPTGSSSGALGVGIGVSDPSNFPPGTAYNPWEPDSEDEEGPITVSLDEGAIEPFKPVDSQNVIITPPLEAFNLLLRWQFANVNWYLNFRYPNVPSGSALYRVPNSETGSSPISVPFRNMATVINQQGNAAAEQFYKTYGWWPTHGGGLPNFGAPWGDARPNKYNSDIVLEDGWTAWRVDYYNLDGELLVGLSQTGSFRRGVVFRTRVVHTANYDYSFQISYPPAPIWPSAPPQL